MSTTVVSSSSAAAASNDARASGENFESVAVGRSCAQRGTKWTDYSVAVEFVAAGSGLVMTDPVAVEIETVGPAVAVVAHAEQSQLLSSAAVVAVPIAALDFAVVVATQASSR